MSLDLFDLSGRVALVTGGSKGLGRAMALGLADAGADVVVSGRDEGDLQEVVGEIEARGRRGAYVVADLAVRPEAQRVAAVALEQFGRVDILVNNAGANTPQVIDEITDEAWDQVVGVHLHSAMSLTRALVPQMKERGWGRIIYISSILGFQGMGGRNAYTTAKAGLRGLMRSNAIDLGLHGINVNCLAPGAFVTGALRNLTDAQKIEVGQRSALLRPAQPDELVGPLLLLASDAGGYVTGTTLVVDGGWLAK